MPENFPMMDGGLQGLGSAQSGDRQGRVQSIG